MKKGGTIKNKLKRRIVKRYIKKHLEIYPGAGIDFSSLNDKENLCFKDMRSVVKFLKRKKIIYSYRMHMYDGINIRLKRYHASAFAE